jgi:hypothetical protein
MAGAEFQVEKFKVQSWAIEFKLALIPAFSPKEKETVGAAFAGFYRVLSDNGAGRSGSGPEDEMPVLHDGTTANQRLFFWRKTANACIKHKLSYKPSHKYPRRRQGTKKTDKKLYATKGQI